VSFVQNFLRETDGGSRLAATTGAFVALMNDRCTVKVHPPTASDHFAQTAGDIEVYARKVLVSAYECKHRPLSLDDVRHGIHKGSRTTAREYIFVTASGTVPGQETSIRRTVLSPSLPFDVVLINIFEVAPAWAAGLNPTKRDAFGSVVERILREEMRRPEVANAAATIWNELEE
jgi:hypothetical protein